MFASTRGYSCGTDSANRYLFETASSTASLRLAGTPAPSASIESDGESFQDREALRFSPLFKSDFLNFFSRVHPAIPAVIFLPVVVAMEWVGVDRGYAAWQLALLTLAGVGVWTLTEYWLHRLVFHWEPDNAFGRRMHFIIHGIHHDHPNDKMRLVMPPSVSIPLAALFFFAFWLILGDAAFPVFGGFLLGYLLSTTRTTTCTISCPAPIFRQAAARTPHAPPLPGPQLRLRRLLAALGSRLPDVSQEAQQVAGSSGTARVGTSSTRRRASQGQISP